MPADRGARTWEQATHVPPQGSGQPPRRLRSSLMGAEPDPVGPLRWEVEPIEHGTVYRLTHEGIGTNAKLVATWHAPLLQPDMWDVELRRRGSGSPVSVRRTAEARVGKVARRVVECRPRRNGHS